MFHTEFLQIFTNQACCYKSFEAEIFVTRLLLHRIVADFQWLTPSEIHRYKITVFSDRIGSDECKIFFFLHLPYFTIMDICPMARRLPFSTPACNRQRFNPERIYPHRTTYFQRLAPNECTDSSPAMIDALSAFWLPNCCVLWLPSLISMVRHRLLNPDAALFIFPLQR